MDAKAGLIVLFVLGASWVCDAGELMTAGFSPGETSTSNFSVLQINNKVSEGASDNVSRTASACSLCEDIASKVLTFLKKDSTQTQITQLLHTICTILFPIKQKCNLWVTTQLPLIFVGLELVQPVIVCASIKLCGQGIITSQPIYENECDVCQYAVAEILVKLKDPETQLEIMDYLLKACDAVNSYAKECKNLVLEFGPLILNHAELLLKTLDMCGAIHVCDLPSAGIKQA